MQLHEEHGFLVDMGRWRRVASPEKLIHAEVGYNWHVSEIEPLDNKGRRLLVKAKYVEPEARAETVSYTLATPQGEKKPEPVMGVDVFPKDQMEKLQSTLDAEHAANRNLAEELAKSRDENKALLEELKKARETGPKIKKVKAPSFAVEGKAQESEFSMLRNCVMSRLSELERFDSQNIRQCAIACGVRERGMTEGKFTRVVVSSLVRRGHIKYAGERNGKKTYRLTKEGLGYLKEVRKDERN